MKNYILNGLEIGIMPENLIEVEKIPSNYRILTNK